MYSLPSAFLFNPSCSIVCFFQPLFCRSISRASRAVGATAVWQCFPPPPLSLPPSPVPPQPSFFYHRRCSPPEKGVRLMRPGLLPFGHGGSVWNQQSLHPLPLPYIPGPSPPVTGVLHVRSLTHPSNRSPPFSRRAPPAGCVSFSLLGGFPRPPASPSHATSPALTPASHPGTQVSCIFDIVSSTSPPLPLTLNSLFPLYPRTPTAVALLLATPTWLGSVPCYGGYSGASVAGGGSHTITFSCPAPRR